MGAWGTKVFEDDDALDWIYELEQEDDLTLIKNVLKTAAAPEDDFLEAPQASQALAAAEIVAALRGKPEPQLPQEAQDWIEKHTLDTAKLHRLAIQAVKRVRNDSELQELWEESEEIENWHAILDGLINRLE